MSAGVAPGIVRRNRWTYASTAGACARAPRSRMFDSALAAAPGFSSASGGFCALGPLRAAFIGPPLESRLSGYRQTVVLRFRTWIRTWTRPREEIPTRDSFIVLDYRHGNIARCG